MNNAAVDLTWITEAIQPTINYWAAKDLIARVLSLIPDDELAHIDFERRENEDGSITLVDYDDDDYFTIGYAGTDGKPLVTQREHAIEAAIKLEVVHRADVKLWSERLAADKEFRMEVANQKLYEVLNQQFAEDVIAGRVIHNVETNLFVAAEVATDEDRAEAVAAYNRMLEKIHGPS